MKFLDWVDNELENSFEDDDSEEEEEEEGPSLRMLGRKLDAEEPSKEVIEGIETLAKDQIDKAVEIVENVWSQLSFLGVTVQMQENMRREVSKAKDKLTFIIRVLRAMLDHDEWSSKEAHDDDNDGLQMNIHINESANNVLLHLSNLFESRVDPILKSKNCQVRTIAAFKMKSTISDLVLQTWQTMLGDDDDECYTWTQTHTQTQAKRTKLPLDLYIPTMRRLGMMDVLDPDWNMFGTWYEIISTMEKAGDRPIKKIPADNILEAQSKLWWGARNSYTCRKMRSSEFVAARLYAGIGPPPPQCFKYFPKCSIYDCPNVETEKSPHKIRCKKCWYFHCCSSACEAYGNMFDMHLCDFTPKEKALEIKIQTEHHLNLNTKVASSSSSSSEKQEKFCNFCLTKEKNHSSKLLRCSGCKGSSSGPVYYCSARCQKWDWDLGKHKMECKKR